MELREYWRIFARRWWLALLPALIVAGYLLATYHRPPTTYQAFMNFAAGLPPEVKPDDYTYDRYYTWLTAEYLVDDLAEVVKSEAFARDVADAAEMPMPPGAIRAATSAGKLHRVLNVSISWPDPDQLAVIANAVVSVLTDQAGVYFAQLSTESAVVSLIDSPTVVPVGPSLRERLDLPLRLALALAAGIGLAFLLHYMDPTVRHRSDAQALGIPLLAEVPARQRMWLLRPGQKRRR
mgnify:CR=1 FL=1